MNKIVAGIMFFLTCVLQTVGSILLCTYFPDAIFGPQKYIILLGIFQFVVLVVNAIFWTTIAEK